VLARALSQLLPDFESREVTWPEDDYQALQAKAAQLRLPLDDEAAPARRGRLAVMMGFSLHADTWVHANDRQGLARLVRYGARGPVAESRLSRRADGRYAYETKRGMTLVLTAAQWVRRLVALIPPRGVHLTNFHGVLAAHCAQRPRLTSSAAPRQGIAKVPASPLTRQRPTRIDWATLRARTFACDVWKCPCGGQRRIVALVTNRRTAEEMLRNMGMLDVAPPLPQAPGPPQLPLLPRSLTRRSIAPTDAHDERLPQTAPTARDTFWLAAKLPIAAALPPLLRPRAAFRTARFGGSNVLTFAQRSSVAHVLRRRPISLTVAVCSRGPS
jgi:hypothetical protein